MRRLLTAFLMLLGLWLVAVAFLFVWPQASQTPPAHAETDRALLALPTEGMQFLAYYVAEDLGFFAQEQLEVRKQVLAGVASFNAVVAGSADFAFASGASITRAASHGQRMLAIAKMNNRPSWDIVLRKDVAEAAHFDPGAPLEQRARVLQGKTMGVQGINALDHAYLKVVARLGGDEDIRVSAMAPVDTLAAFSRKSIDGFVSAPPWPQQVEDDGSAIPVAIGPKGEPSSLVPIASGLVVTRPQLCVDHRSLDLGRELVAACPNGIDAYFENVGGAVQAAVFEQLNPFARVAMCGIDGNAALAGFGRLLDMTGSEGQCLAAAACEYDGAGADPLHLDPRDRPGISP